MNMQSAVYVRNLEDTENVSIDCVIDGTLCSVPIDINNRHYAEILRQVEAGELTIQEAD